jgi:hypothetical protein
MPGTVHGAWYNGVPLNGDSNYVDVTVEVTQTGYYRIGTDQLNGVSFADSGDFVSTGLQVVHLKPIGIFTSPMVSNFTVSFDNMICGFTISVQDSGRGSSVPLNTWRFTVHGRVTSGPATGALYDIPQSTGGIFSVMGNTATNSPDSSLYMEIGMPEYSIFTGTYTTSTIGNRWGFSSANATLYFDYSQTVGSVMTIIITNYDNDIISKTVAGTFSGTADSAGVAVPITNGAFRVKF